MSHAGISSQLRGGGVIETTDVEVADAVALVVVDQVDAECVATMRALRNRGAAHMLLLVSRIDEKGVLAAVEAGATSILRRSEATPSNLLAAIRAASAGEGTLPPDLLGRLLSQVGRLQRQVLHPRGLTFTGLTDREVSVLRLLADGLDTIEVGEQLYLLRADRQEHHPRRHEPPPAAQPHARSRLRDSRGPHLRRVAGPRGAGSGPATADARSRRPIRPFDGLAGRWSGGSASRTLGVMRTECRPVDPHA